jgi:hypothetical protein
MEAQPSGEMRGCGSVCGRALWQVLSWAHSRGPARDHGDAGAATAMGSDDLLDDVLSANLLIGAVKWKSRWRYFAGTLGDWTFDYLAYDPSHRPSPADKDFRGGLLLVDQSNADAFCAAMQPYELAPATIARWAERHGADAVPLVMVADFDARFFVHGYSEPIEPKSKYLPAGWRGVEDDPHKHVPPEVSAPWQPSGEGTAD